MRCATNLVAAWAAVVLLSQAIPAVAVPLTFNASGPANFNGDLDATVIGGLALPEGSATLTGNTIEIEAVPDWLFDKQPVLTGVVFNQQVESTGANPKVTGQAYMVRGDWLKALGGNVAPEVVTLKDGTEFSGHVGSATPTTLEMELFDGTRKSVPLAAVTAIVSPRAFTFEIPSRSMRIQPADNSYAADAINISFSPAVFHHAALAFHSHKPKVPPSTLPGTEGGISSKTLAFFAINDIIVNTLANAIGIPLVMRPPSLINRQLLFFNANESDGQPLFAPQIYANGTVHFYPTK